MEKALTWLRKKVFRKKKANPPREKCVLDSCSAMAASSLPTRMARRLQRHRMRTIPLLLLSDRATSGRRLAAERNRHNVFSTVCTRSETSSIPMSRRLCTLNLASSLL